MYTKKPPLPAPNRLHDLPRGSGFLICKAFVIIQLGKTSEENEKLNALLSYMQDRTVEDPLIARLDLAVQAAKKSSEMRRQYMSYEMDRLRYGKQEKEKGIEEGQARTLELLRMIKEGVSDEEIVSALKCTLSDIQKARAILA